MATKNDVKADTSEFRTLTPRNVFFSHVKDGYVILAVKIDAEHRKLAALSKSAKNRTLGTTGGLVAIPGTDIRVNMTATIPPAE